MNEEIGRKKREINKRFAPEGKIWICSCCGKTSAFDRHGDEHSMKGWDISCAVNSVLVDEEDILEYWPDGRVKKVR